MVLQWYDSHRPLGQMDSAATGEEQGRERRECTPLWAAAGDGGMHGMTPERIAV